MRYISIGQISPTTSAVTTVKTTLYHINLIAGCKSFSLSAALLKISLEKCRITVCASIILSYPWAYTSGDKTLASSTFNPKLDSFIKI